MDTLFPALPEDLHSVSDEDLDALEAQHVAGLQMIREDNREFTGDLNAVQIVEQTRQGQTQLRAIRDHKATLAAAEDNYREVIAELTSDVAEDDGGDDDDEGNKTELAAVEAEPEPVVEEPAVAETEQVAASATQLRRPPAPSPERQPLPEPQIKVGTSVVAAGFAHEWITPGTEFDPSALSKVVIEKARRLGKPKKSAGGTEEKYLLASATFEFPEDRILTDNLAENSRKIRNLRNEENHFLFASGGLCAPLTNIYTIPQFATTLRPVRDGLPSFNADRGGVNVPVPTTLAAAADAITVITAAEDALGGTFATKACLDQTCLDFVETAVTIISHCREYGNLNARAWPESVTFENELTMAEHARVAEGYLLSRIKAQSLQTTATTLVYSTTWELIRAISEAVASIRFNLRMSPDARFRALIPTWVPDNMIVDIAATPFDRFVNRARVTEVLRNAGVDPIFYIDDLAPLTGTSQGFPAEVDGTTLDAFPTVAQIGIFPEGAFIHVDGGTLELGLVRDSTLNSTNDFQFFGESFENVALLAPAQATRWLNVTICPSGEFPALTTALSC